jgi:hypothetical protein
MLQSARPLAPLPDRARVHPSLQAQCVLGLLEPPALQALIREGEACRALQSTARGGLRALLLPHNDAGSTNCSGSGGAHSDSCIAVGSNDYHNGQGVNNPARAEAFVKPQQVLAAAAGAGLCTASVLTAMGGKGSRAARPGSGCSGRLRDSCYSGVDERMLEAAARSFFALMCDGRLFATDWLNEVRVRNGSSSCCGQLWSTALGHAFCKFYIACCCLTGTHGAEPSCSCPLLQLPLPSTGRSLLSCWNPAVWLAPHL